MSSQVEICNLGLIKIGFDAPLITDINEDNKQARLCKRLFPALRDSLLRQNIWRFSLKRQSLAPNTSTVPFGEGKYFTPPTDMIRLVGTSLDQFYNYTPWKIESNGILADAGDRLDIVYVERVTDPNKFDPLFSEMLSAYIGYNLCASLTRDAGVKQAVFDEYQLLSRRAAFVSATERDSAKVIAETFLGSR